MDANAATTAAAMNGAPAAADAPSKPLPGIVNSSATPPPSTPSPTEAMMPVAPVVASSNGNANGTQPAAAFADGAASTSKAAAAGAGGPGSGPKLPPRGSNKSSSSPARQTGAAAAVGASSSSKQNGTPGALVTSTAGDPTPSSSGRPAAAAAGAGPGSGSSHNSSSTPASGAASKPTAAAAAGPSSSAPQKRTPGSSSSSRPPLRATPPGAAVVGRGLGVSLPSRAAVTGDPITDPEESAGTQQLRSKVHAIRVALIRAAQRLAFPEDNGIVKQVLYRLYLAEKLKEPFKAKRGAGGTDVSTAVQRTAEVAAKKLEREQGPASPLGLNVKILFVGLAGSGKTQLIRTLLSSEYAAAASSSSSGQTQSQGLTAGVDAFAGATRRVEVARGMVLGCEFTLIDTPGLQASAAGFAANLAALNQVRKAFLKHRPDLVIYVDRFDRPDRNCHEMAVLQALTRSLGPQVWLNTIVVLTHAGAGAQRDAVSGTVRYDGLEYEKYAAGRTQWLQQVIRHASGDLRLMNPITSVESHPECPRNELGQPVLPNGLPWQQHLLLMIVSAKLLADAEAALSLSPHGQGGAAGGSPANSIMRNDPAMRALMMGRSAAPPVRYLMTQLTQSSQPLTFPDHGAVMEVRRAQSGLKAQRGGRRKKELSRQIKMRLLQMKQMYKRAQRLTDLQVKASKAGAKMVPQVPRTANRSRPGVAPPPAWRYRVPEAGNGWIIRPNIEPHGWDGTDGVEGFVVEKSGVARRDPSDLLHGAPYRASGSASAGKEGALVSARGEVSWYHDAGGSASTTLSGDLQTSHAGAGTPDLLMVVKAECAKAGWPLGANTPAAALLVSRLAQEGRPHRGPVAWGLRLQDSLRLAPRGVPLELDAAAGQMFCRVDGQPQGALGANLEMRTDARRLWGGANAAPLSLSASLLSHGGEGLGAVSAAGQVAAGRGKVVGGKLQVNNRGVATAQLQVRAHRDTWWGLVGLIPLVNLALERLTIMRNGNGRRGSSGGGGSQWQHQQHQQQPLPDIEGLEEEML